MKNKENLSRTCPKCGRIIEYSCYSSWKNACTKNSLCRSCSYKESAKHCADLSKLLEDTNEAYYWIGFLLADGSFYDNRLKLGIAIKDKEHLLKFAKFINYSGTIRETDSKIELQCKDLEVIKKIREKFNINDQKTYNPPKTIFTNNNDLNLSLLAGFIDGDGNIQHPNNRPDFFLRVKLHSSWINILKEFNSLICDQDFCRIESRGYALLNISNTKYLQILKQKVLKLNIPILIRKWDIIDLNFVSKYSSAQVLRDQVIELHKQGYKNKNISSITGTSPANVTKIIKHYE